MRREWMGTGGTEAGDGLVVSSCMVCGTATCEALVIGVPEPIEEAFAVARTPTG